MYDKKDITKDEETNEPSVIEPTKRTNERAKMVKQDSQTKQGKRENNNKTKKRDSPMGSPSGMGNVHNKPHDLVSLNNSGSSIPMDRDNKKELAINNNSNNEPMDDNTQTTISDVPSIQKPESNGRQGIMGRIRRVLDKLFHKEPRQTLKQWFMQDENIDPFLIELEDFITLPPEMIRMAIINFLFAFHDEQTCSQLLQCHGMEEHNAKGFAKRIMQERKRFI